MSQLTPAIAEQFIDACKAGAADAASSLSAALDNAMRIVDVVQGESAGAAHLGEDLSGPGLALVFHVGEEAAALLLPEATNLLPPWYVEPDANGNNKLQTLAQELAALLLPADLAAGDFAAGAVANLADALRAAELGDPAGRVQLSMTGDDGQGNFHLVWPLAKGAALNSPSPKARPKPFSPLPASAAPVAAGDGDADSDIAPLPSYSRSLLNIRVPLIVNLASTKMKVDDVIHLGPGSIIQFDKSCEDSLGLEAGGHELAQGEAVKVGDKFGLRITSIRLPEERYKTVGK